MALMKDTLYIPKNFRISPNLPESNARSLARYFSLWVGVPLARGKGEGRRGTRRDRS